MNKGPAKYRKIRLANGHNTLRISNYMIVSKSIDHGKKTNKQTEIRMTLQKLSLSKRKQFKKFPVTGLNFHCGELRLSASV